MAIGPQTAVCALHAAHSKSNTFLSLPSPDKGPKSDSIATWSHFDFNACQMATAQVLPGARYSGADGRKDWQTTMQ